MGAMRYFVAAAIVVTFAGAAVAQSTDIDVQQRTMGPASELPVPVAQMSTSDISAYETGVRNGVVRGWQSGGVTISPADVGLTSDLAPAGGGLKIIRTKVVVRAKSFQWVFMGVADGNIVTVFCTSKTAQPFELGGSECDRRVKQVFGQ